jgi:hypothetical protein
MDHVAINFFVAFEPYEFAEERMAKGTNHTLRIGHEFHTLSELRHWVRSLPVMSVDFIKLRPELDAISLSLQDRCNWPGCTIGIESGEIPIFVPRIRIAVEMDDGSMVYLLDQPGRP